MNAVFLRSFQSEWIKKRRSAASWLVWIGGFLVPAVMLMARFNSFDSIASVNASDTVWNNLYHRSWQYMSIFLLPMGVILAASLITQIEFRNNTWKQLHATPQRLTTIYFAKLSVILVMLLQFFILFNIGIFLLGVIPAVLFKSIPFPQQAFTLSLLFKQNSGYFLYCLPIVALQYLISLQFKNFLVPVGAGLGLLIVSMVAVNWRYGYIVPYSYCTYGFLGSGLLKNKGININYWAMGYFVLFTLAGYFLYLGKKEK